MDTTLKQRLIGAVVLVALAVIFLPMLVQGPAPDSGVADVSMRVPDAPSGEYQTRELPLLAPPSDASRGPLPSPAQEPAAAAAADDAPAARPDPASAAGQWAVSFGAYASAADADAVLARLRQAGLAGFSQTATLNGSKAWRVRVGPYPDRALAEAGRLQAIRIRNDVNAQVIALDAGEGEGQTAAAPATPATTPAAATTAAAAPAPAPTVAAAAVPERTVTRATSDPAPARSQPPVATSPAPKPATAPTPAPAPPAAPAASGVGFAVQMGAFASTADANALRDRLRAAGYSAIVQPVRTDKGLLNRVRVGPMNGRAEAEQAKARLAAGGFGAGMVVPHP